MLRHSWGLGVIALCVCGCDISRDDYTLSVPTPPTSGGAFSGGSGSFAGDVGLGFGGSSPVGQPSLPGAVFTATEPAPPISGGTLLITKEGHTAVVADTDRSRVFVVDLDNATLLHDIALPARSEPGRLAEDASGNVHVALRGSGQLATLDIAAGRLLGSRDVCRYPRGVAVADAENLVHVACAEGQLVTLSTDVTQTAPQRSLRLDRDLRDVVVASSGLWLSRFRSAEILRLDAEGTVTRRISLPAAAGFQGPDEPLRANVAWRMIASKTGGVTVVHQRAVTSEVIPSPGGYGFGSPDSGIVQTAVSTVEDDVPPQSTSVALNAPLAVDVAESSNGEQLLLATAAYEHPQSPSFMARTPLLNKESLSFAEQPVVQGFAFADSAASTETVPNAQIVAVGFSGSTPVLQLREPNSLIIGDRGVILPGDSAVDTGNMLFHLRTGSGLACASCHPEGQEDGHTWSFQGFGKRRTQSLRGGLLGTEPLHWDGLEQDFNALALDVMQGRMSGPSLNGEQIDALSHYIDRFAAMPSSLAGDASTVARGKELFEDGKVGCATCHSGSRFSNDKTVDVGVEGELLQVPSLVGLWARAPYLHDGCAGTIADRFTPACDSGKHGDLSGLTSEDVAALSAYLETL